MDCRRVADALDIPFYVLDMRREFQKVVMDYFSNNYLRGLTPNPCIQCNGVLKFRILLKRAQIFGSLSHGYHRSLCKISDDNTLMQKLSIPTKIKVISSFPSQVKPCLKHSFLLEE